MSYDRVISFRPDTSTNWATNNPVLSQGEGAFETDTGIIKIGDGTTAYNSLPAYKFPTIDSSNNMVLTPESGGQVSVPAQLNITGASRFFADGVAALSIAATTWTIVPFETKQYDNLGEYNNTTYQWTAQKDGYYLFGAAVQLASASWSTGDAQFLSIFKNGVEVKIIADHRAEAAYTNYVALIGNVLPLFLVAGDVIDIRVYSSVAANLYTGNSMERYFYGYRLS